MRRLLVLPLVLLAGCLGGGDKGDPTGGPGATLTPTQSVRLEVAMDRPEWQLAQVWTYRIEIPGLPTARFKMMVAEDRGDLWIVATDDRAKALNHALYSTNPVLGRITKESLSPFQAGGPVRMFDFPLSDGKTWSGPFFGETMAFRASYSDTIEATPGSFLPGFHVLARGSDQARVEYDYVEAVEWFSDFAVYDRTGTKQIHLILEDAHAGYAGPYHFLRGRDQFVALFTQSTNLTPPTTFEVKDEFQRLAVGLAAEGTGDQPAIVNVTLKDPGGVVAYTRQHTLPKHAQESEAKEIAAPKGVWTVEVTIVGSARVDLRAVGLLVTEGTL